MLDFVQLLQNQSHAYLGPGFARNPPQNQGIVLTKRTRIDTLSLVEIEETQHAQALVELLKKIDNLWPKLNDNEGVFFFVGYDAAAALHDYKTRNDLKSHHFGPDAFLEKVNIEASENLRAPNETYEPTLMVDVDAKRAHLKSIERLKKEIEAGVTYQANLAHAIAVKEASRIEAARFFAHAKRPAFSAFVSLGNFGDLVSLSPECFINFSMQKRLAWAKPIKGTRPRGPTRQEDEALLQQLASSTKDCAEHDMIVDLLRNDLGAVSKSVVVESLRDVISVKNVHHLESTIRGELSDDTRLSDLLCATLPAGSITGAPKSTAVEQIALLERQKRGPYTGILGLVDNKGEGSASILIRTWIRKNAGPGTLHSGGGIVWDSDAAAEWQETLDKAQAFSSQKKL